MAKYVQKNRLSCFPQRCINQSKGRRRRFIIFACTFFTKTFSDSPYCSIVQYDLLLQLNGC